MSRGGRPNAAAMFATLGMPSVLASTASYPIGTAGVPWGAAEKAAWLAQRTAQRSYKEEVCAKVEALKEQFEVQQYGALSYNPERYPLFALRTRNWAAGKPSVLVTGGMSIGMRLDRPCDVA